MGALTLLLAFSFSGCYSFKGISIDPDIHSYQVENFSDESPEGAPLSLPDEFAMELDKKIRTETRLKPDNPPDLSFQGAITRFKVVPGPITSAEATSFNRLELVVKISSIHRNDPKKNWTKSFSHYEEFPSDQNLSDVQDELLKKIKDKLIEDIFNKAFTNW